MHSKLNYSSQYCSTRMCSDRAETKIKCMTKLKLFRSHHVGPPPLPSPILDFRCQSTNNFDKQQQQQQHKLWSQQTKHLSHSTQLQHSTSFRRIKKLPAYNIMHCPAGEPSLGHTHIQRAENFHLLQVPLSLKAYLNMLATMMVGSHDN